MYFLVSVLLAAVLLIILWNHLVVDTVQFYQKNPGFFWVVTVVLAVWFGYTLFWGNR